jgi:transposase
LLQSCSIRCRQTKVCVIIGYKGFDSEDYRAALQAKNYTPCIPSLKGLIILTNFDNNLCHQRHKNKNLFARLKDWHRIHTRYHKCARIFLAVITIAAICAFWIN